jgi:alanyl-tRNA synthetase
MKSGAAAVFDEKYGDRVRVVHMGDISAELCGGTHVRHTGDIGLLKVVSEASVAAGVRRIEALAGREAVKYLLSLEDDLRKTAELLRAGSNEVADRVDKLLKHQRALEKEIEALKGKLAAKDSANILDRAMEIKGVKVLAVKVDASDVKSLRDFGDKVRDKLGSGVILLGSAAGDKAMLLCLVTKDLTGRYHAGNIIKAIAPIVGGSGGGRPDLAQAGGPKVDALDEALRRLAALI